MSKIGAPLNYDISDAGFDKFMNRPFEGLGQASREWEESQGYSYDDLVINMEKLNTKSFTTTVAFTSTDYRTVTWAANGVIS